MEFRVLGPVEMWSAGRCVDIGHVKERAVLAALVLDLGKVVPIDSLIDRVWGDGPPASVRKNLYAYVARLRSAIAGADHKHVALTHGPGGYVLEADPGQVDLYGFRRLVAEAATADDERAAELLSEALGLWRGPALAGLTSPWLRSMSDTLERQRIAAVLDHGDIELRRGEHAALSVMLAEQAVAHPADERLIGQLMLALYRSGSQADALRRYEQTRQRLAEELGADPGPQLRMLHQRILRNDPALAGSGSAARPVRPGPRELPADIPAFTGRSAELSELDRLLTGRAEPTAMVISAVSGTAGVGKTALAIHWSHRVAEHFPDGQLYVNLRGYDPSQPSTGAEALARLLRTLSGPGQDIPDDEDERATRYRSLLAGKRMLIVLDNAQSAEQVRPLLPGTPACMVLVTSRDALTGLIARDGATRLELDVLPPEDAADLLRALIGQRADADLDAVAALAAQCCRLPLALRAAAELAGARSATPLGDLAAELAEQRKRLDQPAR
jgi:DNA-binding SARP family transcriptional activator